MPRVPATCPTTSHQQLYPSPQTPPTFSGTISFPTAVSLTPDTTIRIYPAKSGTGEQGPVELQGSLNRCHS